MHSLDKLLIVGKKKFAQETTGNVFFAVQKKIYISITTCLTQKAEHHLQQQMFAYFV